MNNKNRTEFRLACKQYAKQTIGMNARLLLRASAAVTAVTLLLSWLKMSFGHNIYYYLLSCADTDAPTGLQWGSAGFSAVLRLEMSDMVLAIQSTWSALVPFLIETLIILAIVIPLMYGALESFCKVLRGQSCEFSDLLEYYRRPKKFLKCIAIDLPLRVLLIAGKLVGVLPGMAIMSYTFRLDNGLGNLAIRALSTASTIVALLGMAVLYFFVCQLIPARYMLAAHPELSIGEVLGRTIEVLKGRRKEYFVFCLSFVIWQLINSATYGVLDIFLLPYMAISNLVLIRIIPAKGEDTEYYGF